MDARRIMALFSGHQNAHGTHGEPTRVPGKLKWEIKSTAKTLREAVTLDMWVRHLRGERPLGIIPIRGDGTSVWGSIDVDVYDDDHAEARAQVKKAGLPLVPCWSKSGGMHLFLFLQEALPAGALQAVLRDASALLGLSGSEIFPKQSHILEERGDVGNWMVMPYFGSTYDGKLHEQVGISDDGRSLSLKEFLKVVEASRATSEQLSTIGSRTRSKKSSGQSSATDFADGPVCLQHMATLGFPEGGRNSALFHMGVYYKKRFAVNWKTQLEEANQRYMKPPLSSDEVAVTVRSLEKKDYDYKCSDDPMVGHCNSVVCRTRRFGVGEAGNYPEIASISKLDTNPAIWFVDTGGHRLELTVDELTNYVVFHKRCIEETNICYKIMKQKDWLELLNLAMKNLTVIEASPDLGMIGSFHEMLEDFLTSRKRGQRREDITSGRPWEDDEEKVHYFRLRDLQKHLEREDFRDERGNRVGRNKISRYIVKLGGGPTFFNIRGKGVHVWWVPSQIIEETPPAEPPPIRESEI